MQLPYRLLLISLCLILLFLFKALPVRAATITVTGACTLVDAITAANTDTATGSCPAGSGADTIDLTGNITLTAIVDTTEGDSALPSVTSNITINGNGFTISRSGATLFRLIHVSAGGSLSLDRVTLDNGNLGFAVASTDGEGGAVFNRGTLNLNSTLILNSRAFRGGGLANYGVLMVSDSIFSNNTAEIRAGGIWNTTTATINATLIMNNAVNFGFGGGIRNFSGTMTITNSLIMNNMADTGQGISNNTGATLIVSNSTITGNTGFGSGGGGGLDNLGTATIEYSTISNNAVSDSGGAGIRNEGSLTLINSTISGNLALSLGGGGIRNNSPGTIILTNVTISNNSSDSHGGGIVTDGGSGTVTANNTIIANNSAPSNANCSAFPGDITGSNNLSSDATCDGFGSITPGVHYSTTLMNNGGVTETHALLPSAGNPAIDTGGACGLATDQRAFTRDAACDIGAYELIQPTFLFTLNASSVAEGGTANPQIQLQLAQSAPITGIFSVDINYTDVTATTALDYTPDTSISFDCSAGCTSNQVANLSIPTIDDTLLENAETVDLSLTNPIVGIIGSTFAAHTLTITDNDSAVASIAATLDGAEPATNGQFTLTLSALNATGTPITVNYTVAGSATSGSDYTALAGSVNIPDGANSATIDVLTLDDVFPETVETVIVTLIGTSNPNVTVDTTPATVNVLDNETAGVTISPTGLGIVEGNTGNYSIVLNTEPAPGEIVTITVAISGAASGEIASTSSLNFNFDNTNWNIPQNFSITLNDDLISNGNRSYVAAFMHSSDSTLPTSGYDATATLAINSVDLNVIDNESPNVVINPTAFTLVVGNTRTYDVFLTVEPGANVTISLTQLDANCIISPTTLIFTDSAGANPWNVPQQISVTGVGAAGSTCTIQHSPAGGGYTGLIASVVVRLRILPTPVSPASTDSEPDFTVSDPAISKLGLLYPGQTGITGEQIEWFITVTNGNIPQAITVNDTLIPALQIDAVNALNATHSISGQTFTVTSPFLNAGQSYTFSILTTVLSGATVNNTACIANTDICATGLMVSELPSTGETPFWNLALLLFIVLMGIALGLLAYKQKLSQ